MTETTLNTAVCGACGSKAFQVRLMPGEKLQHQHMQYSSTGWVDLGWSIVAHEAGSE